MTKIVFTICSNNYLAQAKTLGDSVLKHNSDYKFIICLCDKKNSNIDYSFFSPHEIIEVADIGIEKFNKMCRQYNIIELNTSIKPFVFDYLFKNHKNVDYVMYFDPDTYVFDKLTVIEEELIDSSILLTPHIYTPIEFDGKTPTENTFTQHGIYNLGFAALKRSEEAQKLLEWWKRRLEVNCYINYENGIFVDQMPMNYAPLFFNNVKISKQGGINMAPWNLHERHLTLENEKYMVNHKYPLILYHFSNCNPKDFDSLAGNYTRPSFEGNETLKLIYDVYKKEVIENKYDLLTSINCVYSKKAKKQDKIIKKKNIILRFLNKFEQLFIRKGVQCVKNLLKYQS